ncbi:MAG TPA: hypothetical protein VN877_02770 [Opitutaceae bacterium]|nr:hypothetical protein [Opitutaceae bacterium]
MQFLGLLFILAQLSVNLWGLTLLAGVLWRNRWFALAAGPLLATTAVYAVECFHGLGPSLLGLGQLSFVLSAALIAFSCGTWEPAILGSRGTELLRQWRSEFAPRRLVGCLGIFAAVFLYAMAWRYTDPNLNGGSEKDADFSYICSYYSGATIPVPDYWYYPYPSDHYYSFQHYGAALVGRVLQLPRGTAYNISFCLLVALGGAAFSGAVVLATRRAWVRALLIAGFVVGGTGATLLVHLTEKDVGPMTSMRFIGTAQIDKAPLGPWLKAYKMKYSKITPDGVALDMALPSEPFAYSIYWGDYHAPLSGYYLLGIAVMGMMLWSRVGQRRYAAFVGGVLTWSVLANPWSLPLQAILTAGWIAANWRDGRRLILSVAAGAAAVWLAASTYLSAFTAAGVGTGATFRLVAAAEHTPPLLFLLFHSTTLALIALGFASGHPKGRRLAALWLVILLFSEFVYLDSVYVGTDDRTNSTLKWWPWITAGALMTLGPHVLEQTRRRWVRVAGTLVCLYPCFYAYDLWVVLRDRVNESTGHLEGSYLLTQDENSRFILDRLSVERPGVVVERPDRQGGFTDSAVIPLFAGKQLWLGWSGHELLWRSFKDEIRRRFTALTLLYGGDLPDAGKWLGAQGIDFVLWYRPDDTPELWEKVNRSIGPGYEWLDVRVFQEKDLDVRKVGYWRRVAAAAP